MVGREGQSELHIGLCEGRHPIERNDGVMVEEFIFQQVENPMDFFGHFEYAMHYLANRHNGYDICLYTTGLTPLLTATLLAAEKAGVQCLVLMHYDRESGKYLPQDVSALL